MSGFPNDLSLREDERWPFYAEDEIAAAASVLRSGKVNQWTGPHVAQFEQACTDRFGGGHGIAVANGSLALDLALLALEIGPGDEVIVTPRTFVASAFCVMLAGATPVFADVDRESGNITPGTIEPVLTERTRAIIPVHLGGWPADMPGIMALAEEHGLAVIEDCAQAHGAAIDGKSVGSFGHAAAFSFCQDKIISTGGEGGFVSFRDKDAADWARSFKDHGKTFEKVSEGGGSPGEFKWLHDQVGTNWRLTGPQAAIGSAQLSKLEEWNAIRTQNAQIWAAALNEIAGVRVSKPRINERHALYKFYFQLDVPEEDASRLRSKILTRSAEEGLRVFSGSCSEVYREQAFAELQPPDCPNARYLGKASLMLEVHPTLRQDLLERRAKRLSEIIVQVLG
ncbi:DegT/DnrJ/EryC1/StrS family aminotransferase [Sphingomonas daechungensis]|uniref:DegT/DnrJ/EryC1/StrS family aminotransferase n=1 Tax=Sphingomonas daechungensis TaxID=1176646 RepID=UPI003783906D